MNKIIGLFIALLLVNILYADPASENNKVKKEDDIVIKNDKDRVSYSLGVNFAKNIKSQKINVNPKILLMAIEDVLKGGKLKMSEKDISQAIYDHYKNLESNHKKEYKYLSDKNKTIGKNFTKKFKENEGVIELPNGILYKVINEGKGQLATSEDTVVVNFKTELVGGKIITDTFKTKKPMVTSVKDLTKPWIDMVQMMKVGSKWQVVVPPKLAYGEKGDGDKIGPFATLIYEIELKEIK